MPKLKETDREKRDKLFRGLCLKNMEIHGVKKPDLAEWLNITPRAFRYKFNEPDRFTRKELSAIFCILRFSAEEKSLVI